MDDQDEVGAAVAVDVADAQVARLDQVVDVAERLALEDLEREGTLEVGLAGVGDDLDEVLGDVGQDDVGAAVGVEVAGGEVGEPGLGPVRLVAGQRSGAAAPSGRSARRRSGRSRPAAGRRGRRRRGRRRTCPGSRSARPRASRPAGRRPPSRPGRAATWRSCRAGRSPWCRRRRCRARRPPGSGPSPGRCCTGP